jgi:hypothetical protein
MIEADGSTPELVSDLANSCARFVEKALGVPLDGTQDTLPLLDHYLRDAANEDDEVLGLVVPAAGAYFGQVLRHHLGGGRWLGVGQDYEAFRLVLDPGPITFNPIGVVYECVTGAPSEGGEISVPKEHERVLKDVLAAMGDVREEDYYTLAVRLEVLEQLQTSLARISSAAAQN